MKIIFISNYFTHHQKPLSDALFKLTKGEYIFLATEKMSEERKNQGWSINLPEYVKELDINNTDSVNKYISLINKADAVIQGHLYDKLIDERVRKGKLTFIYNERLYKSFKRYLKLPIYLYKGLKYRQCYILAASAYTSYDYSLTRSYYNRCYKFGYFPELKIYTNIDKFMTQKDNNQIVWVARFIDWKHPEIPIKIAKRLKEEGYDFRLKMIGAGPLTDKYRIEISRQGLGDYVTMVGPITPEQVRLEMEQAGIFLFTSDRNEGWGAVLNEAMNSGCSVIVNHEIGAAPYLIKDGYNGLLFEDGNIEDLYVKVKKTLCSLKLQRQMGVQAIKTIVDTWNANNAAINLLKLINNLNNGTHFTISGPCSKAEIIKDNWYKCQ